MFPDRIGIIYMAADSSYIHGTKKVPWPVLGTRLAKKEELKWKKEEMKK